MSRNELYIGGAAVGATAAAAAAAAVAISTPLETQQAHTQTLQPLTARACRCLKPS